MLDFDRVQTALESLGAEVDAAEAHGTLCALLLEDAALPIWLGHILEELPAKGDVLANERLGVLETLYRDTAAQMQDDELSLEILLPDESDDFGLRLMALAGWCQGFLFGFGVSVSITEEALDDDGRECLSDLLEMSKLSHDEEPSDEADEQYAELVEHLRIVTLTLKESLQALPASKTLH